MTHPLAANYSFAVQPKAWKKSPRKKSKGKRSTRRAKKPAVLRPARKQRRKGVVPKRRAAKKPTARALHELSPKKRETVFRQIHQVLKRHGVQGSIAELQTAAPPVRSAAKAAVAACPPGTIRRVVCRRDPVTLTMVCNEECVPRPV